MPKFFYIGDSTPTYDFTTNLMASYRLSADANDYTGNHNGTPTNVTYGGSDYAIFDGTASILVSDSDDFSFTDGAGDDLPCTISFWAYADDNSGTHRILLKTNISGQREWQIYQGSSIYNFDLYSQTTSSNFIRWALPAITTSTWIHYVVTYTGSNTISGLGGYRNGLTYGSSTSGGTYVEMTNTVNPLYIGSGGFSGRLKRIHIWKNRVLTADEITYMHDVELAGGSIL